MSRASRSPTSLPVSESNAPPNSCRRALASACASKLRASDRTLDQTDIAATQEGRSRGREQGPVICACHARCGGTGGWDWRRGHSIIWRPFGHLPTRRRHWSGRRDDLYATTATRAGCARRNAAAQDTAATETPINRPPAPTQSSSNTPGRNVCLLELVAPQPLSPIIYYYVRL